MHYDIEGTVAQPDPRIVWRCPDCRRERTDETGTTSGLMCAGDPITGALHPPADMKRDGMFPVEYEALRQRARTTGGRT